MEKESQSPPLEVVLLIKGDLLNDIKFGRFIKLREEPLKNIITSKLIFGIWIVSSSNSYSL